MSDKVVSVDCWIQAQSRRGRFSVPRAALNALGLGDGERVHLRITCAAGSFELSIDMRSGTEIYAHADAPGSERLESIEPRERIYLTVGRP